MIILYCETCGKRIPNEHLQQLGIVEAKPDAKYFCPNCLPAAPAQSSAETATATRLARMSTGTRPAVKTGMRAPITVPTRPARPGSGGVPTTQEAHAARPSPGRMAPAGAPAPNRTKLIAAAIVVGTLMGIAVTVLAFGNRSAARSQVANADSKKTPPLRTPANPNAPVTQVPQVPPVGPVASALSAGPSSPPALPAETPAVSPPSDRGEKKPPTEELSPKEAYEQKVRAGLIKPETPATPAAPDAPPTPAPPAGGDLQSTDPEALRKALLAIGHGAPRDGVKRLGELPEPAMPETVVYKLDLDKGNPYNWRSDYGSKVNIVNEEGERCIKASGGSDRIACYGNAPVFANRSRVNLRIFHKGLKNMRISIQSAFNVRYNCNFDAPAEGQWQDVTVDLSKLKSGEFNVANQQFGHIELHGFRKNNSAYFLLSKFDIVNGDTK